MRRKLGEITRRFENVELKYRNLKEVGINEANSNMEKLRKQCDATTQASNELIASLKRELAMQAPSVQDARKLKNQMQTQEVETNQLRSSNAEISAALLAAQNEIKSLQAKLAAARSTSESSRTPARDAKSTASSKPVAATSASEAVQIAQMKEELYSDLTGLIVRSAKRGEDGDTYDCIQTGRNGSKCISTQVLVTRLTFDSSTLQALCRRRRRKELKLRANRLPISATTRRQQRSRHDGANAGLSDRGDYLLQTRRSQVLWPCTGYSDETEGRRIESEPVRGFHTRNNWYRHSLVET